MYTVLHGLLQPYNLDKQYFNPDPEALRWVENYKQQASNKTSKPLPRQLNHHRVKELNLPIQSNREDGKLRLMAINTMTGSIDPYVEPSTNDHVKNGSKICVNKPHYPLYKPNDDMNWHPRIESQTVDQRVFKVDNTTTPIFGVQNQSSEINTPKDRNTSIFIPENDAQHILDMAYNRKSAEARLKESKERVLQLSLGAGVPPKQ
jgi:hypothetical protein